MAARPTNRTARTATRNAAPARKASAPATRKPNLTEHATKDATAYQKAFARWLVGETGVDLNALSPKAAFLKGVSMASALRSAFQSSDAAAEFWENSGEVKRGPKPKAVETTAPRRGRPAKPAPQPEPEEEEWEDEEAEEAEEADDDFEDEAEETEEDDWEEEDEEETPPPAPKRAPAAKKAAPPVKKAAPAKRAAKPAPAEDDDDFIF